MNAKYSRSFLAGTIVAVLATAAAAPAIANDERVLILRPDGTYEFAGRASEAVSAPVTQAPPQTEREGPIRKRKHRRPAAPATLTTDGVPAMDGWSGGAMIDTLGGVSLEPRAGYWWDYFGLDAGGRYQFVTIETPADGVPDVETWSIFGGASVGLQVWRLRSSLRLEYRYTRSLVPISETDTEFQEAQFAEYSANLEYAVSDRFYLALTAVQLRELVQASGTGAWVDAWGLGIASSFGAFVRF